MAQILPIRRKTLYNQSINQSIARTYSTICSNTCTYGYIKSNRTDCVLGPNVEVSLGQKHKNGSF